MPQPAAPGLVYGATYDAWNRQVALTANGSLIAGYQYDGVNRRTVKNLYTGGVMSSTRHLFYSSEWQVLEERVGASNSAERQFVWGVRYLDDLILRDRASIGSGPLNERLFGMQDPNWNLTAFSDTSGTVQERYGYDTYGNATVLSPGFVVRPATLYDWETRYSGYRWDAESGLYQVRNRVYESYLGSWVSRDWLGNEWDDANLYRYTGNYPVNAVDPSGEVTINLTPVGKPLFTGRAGGVQTDITISLRGARLRARGGGLFGASGLMVVEGVEGWLIQHVTQVRVFVGLLKPRPPLPPLPRSTYFKEYWEAWKTRHNAVWNPYSNDPTPPGRDRFFWPNVGACTAGTEVTLGQMHYFENRFLRTGLFSREDILVNPAFGWASGAVENAGRLMSTSTRPIYWMDTGATLHILSATWNYLFPPFVMRTTVMRIIPKPAGGPFVAP
jgi:RHS repeat-associated protein